MKTLYRLLPILGIAAAAMAANAQNLKTEITVDRTIVPVEREAVRLGSLSPQLITAPVNYRRLTPADYTTAATLTRSASVLEPAAYGDSLALSSYRGYASLGYFPAFNLGASAGYRFIDKRNTRLGAWIQYDGYSYGSNDKDIEGKYKNNTARLGLRFDQRFGRSTSFSAAADYSYSAIGLPDIFENKSQNSNYFALNLGLWTRSNSLAFHLNGDFSHFGYGKDVLLPTAGYLFEGFQTPTEYINYKPASENRFTFKGGMTYLGASSTPIAGIELSLDFLSRSNGIEQGLYTNASGTEFGAGNINGGTLGVVSITPYYAIASGNVHGRIGAKIDISTGGSGKKFHIAPAVMLDWNASSKFAIYALVEGGEHLNSLASLYDYCPFMPGIWQYQRSHIPFSAELGINVGPVSGFSAKLFGGFTKANDWLMPQTAHIDIQNDALPYFTGVNYGYYDLKSWHAGIKLEYDWQSKVKVNASAETAPNDIDKSYYMWRDRAKYVINAGIEVAPFEPLKVGLSYELRADRRNYDIASDGRSEAIDIKDLNNLSLYASYALNSQFSIFARGENLLNKRYFLISEIESQGLKGLIGVSYKF